MATKPKTQTPTRQGTANHSILNILLNRAGVPQFASYRQLTEHLNTTFDESFSTESVSKAIRYYNAGLYSVYGVAVKNSGSLDFINSQIEDELEDYEEYEDRRTKSRKKPQGGRVNDSSEEETISKYKAHCEDLGIDYKKASGSFLKLNDMTIRMPHAGADRGDLEEQIDDVKRQLKADGFFKTTKVKPTKSRKKNPSIGVVNLTDLHIGAFVEKLIKTPDYNTDILKSRLEQAVGHINRLGFDEVRVNLLGDILHSVTGLNHPNTFKECQQSLFGPKVIKLATEILHTNFLSKINNLGKINQIAGNHGRLEQSAKNDSKGGGEDLVAWGLELMGYDIEFNPLLISEEIDGIQYVLLHGDKGVSRRATKDIIWDYGKQGIYNFLLSGHLHSRISRMTAKAVDKFEMVSDDSIDCRAQVLPSVFSGDSYSDDNNWFTSAGIMICYNNGSGKPVTIDIPLD